MQQLLIKKGKVYPSSIPSPIVEPGNVLVEVAYSLVSTGTESSMVKSSGESLIKKAKDPNLFKLGLDAVKRNGVMKTLQLIRTVQESGTAFGYSLSGKVIAIGDGIRDLQVGDPVACAGAGKANHAEYVSVPRNLVTPVPKDVDLADAASTTLGAIALQGVRQADLRLGETVAVVGTGLLGLLAVQMLKASGCLVIVSDSDPNRLKLARAFGADHAVSPDQLTSIVNNLTGSKGLDATIIYAATSSDAPLNQAMAITRKRGTVVVVGAIGMHLNRSPWYEKEINLKISCSYGPGRYDPNYEEKGQDYPFGFVRWTENRNMQAYLELISAKKLDFQKMVEKVVGVDEAPDVYAELVDPNQKNKPLAVLIKFPELKDEIAMRSELAYTPSKPQKITTGQIKVGFIGVGGFISAMHLPNIASLNQDFKIVAISDRSGVTARNLAEQYGATHISTDYKELLKQSDIDLVVIGTRHNSHAEIAIEALKSGKSVFVEKPLAMNQKELDEVIKTAESTNQTLFVGFNRRFSPHSTTIKQALQNRIQPLTVYYRMNAGYIPSSHWTQTDEGGGRIIGEACHIYDLFNYWTGSKPIEITTNAIQTKDGEVIPSDNLTTTIRYQDGSVCTLIYTAQGNGTMEKEYAEMFFDRKSIVLHDYHETTGYGVNCKLKTTTQDKGHMEEMRQVARSLRGKHNDWDLNQIILASEMSLLIDQQLKAN